MDKPTVLYKYDYIYVHDEFSELGKNVKLVLYKLHVLRYTPKGVWIDTRKTIASNPYYYQNKFVLLSGRKRYAWPTKEEALESFIIRKKKHIYFIQTKLDDVKEALRQARELWDKEFFLEEK